MRITTGLLKKFGDINIPSEEIIKIIKEKIGEVEYFHKIGEDYENIVIAEIVGKENHPDADKLGVYQINYGEDENIQVVAGDKNLEIGDKVAYLKIGSKVPYTIYSEEEPFEIKAVKLRGILSNGMLGSEKELNIGSNHERVMVLPKDAPVGESFAEYYDLNDSIIEIENKALTNRGDLFSIIGISREINAVIGNKYENKDEYPEIVTEENTCLKLEIINDAESLCPRYTAIALDNVSIQESPIWLRSILIKCGIKPINNIVDITNYISLLIGQPLHAFDYDKVSKNSGDSNYASINIRMSNTEESILALDDKTYQLTEENIVIADNLHPIAIAGVIGGRDTEIDNNTKRVILESANFDKTSIRKTSMKLGLFTDASTKFKHSLDPEQCIHALKLAIKMIKELGNATVASDIIDIYPQRLERKTVPIDVEDLNTTLGTDISKEEILKILENLGYIIEERDSIYITAPSWRRDISIREDVYEDVARIHGLNNIPIDLPKKSILPPIKNNIFETKKLIRDILSNNGANELLTYSFTSKEAFENSLSDINLAYQVKNPLSPELSLMRTSLMISLIQKAKENIDRGVTGMAIYEMNIPHCKDLLNEEGLPTEKWMLSLLISLNEKCLNSFSPYYTAKSYLEKVLNGLQVRDLQLNLVIDSSEIDLPVSTKSLLNMFNPYTSAIVSIQGEVIGIVGEFKEEVKEKNHLPRYSGGFEIDLNKLVEIGTLNSIQYSEQPKYPSIIKDLCFDCEIDTKYIEIYNEIERIINSNNLWGRVECLDIFQKEGTVEKKRLTYRITTSNYSKTLKDKDIKEIIQKIKKKIESKYQATLV